MYTSVKMASLKVFCVLVFIPLVLSQTTGPRVNLDVGTVEGKYETVTRGSEQFQVHTYLGIPFSLPPVGDHRFKKPEPVVRLAVDPYDASYYRPICPQLEAPWVGIEDEDCLYLNVFVPEGSADSTGGFAVMVWVHGGGFTSGAGQEYHGAYLAATGNVIVVTINYRLGLFGFFSTREGNVGGNFGLYDQALAFQWVKDNIGRFNGDTNRVTIFGESAGAMSVTHQGLYQKNYGLFQRIIAQSGSAFLPGVDFEQDTTKGVMILAENVGCSDLSMYDTVECLKRIPWQTMKEKYVELYSDPANYPLMAFTTRVDGDIISQNPYDLPKETDGYVPESVKFFRSLDFLSGVNLYEGALYLLYFHGGVEVQYTPEEMKNNLIPNMMMMDFRVMASESLSQAISHEYTNWSMPYLSEAIRLEYVKALGDATFVSSAVQNIMLNIDDGKQDRTYAYHFLPAPSSRTPGYTPTWLPGANHAEELTFLFPGAFGLTLNAEEQVLSDRMVVYWTNFAKTGNPNTPVTSDVAWSAYNHDHQTYMELDKHMDSTSQKHYFGARPAHFWNHVVQGLIENQENSGWDCHVTDSSSASMANMMVILAALVIGYFTI